MRLRRAVLQIPRKLPVPPGLPLYKSCHSLSRSESTLLQVLIPLHFISFISNTYVKPGGGTPLPAPKFGNSSLPPLPNLSFRAQRGICFCLFHRYLIASLSHRPLCAHSNDCLSRAHWARGNSFSSKRLLTLSITPGGGGHHHGRQCGTAILGCLLPFFPFLTLTHMFAHSPRTSADSASLRYPFLVPRPSSTLNSRPLLPRQELPSQICYRPLAPVFAHRPGPSSRAKRGISLLGSRRRSQHAVP